MSKKEDRYKSSRKYHESATGLVSSANKLCAMGGFLALRSNLMIEPSIRERGTILDE
jgi:hypothetical protein